MANVIEVLLRTRSDTSGVDRFKRSIGGIKSLLPALGAVGAAGGLLALARGAASASDEVTQLQSKLRLVTSGTAELVKVQEQIVNLARQTRTDFSSVGELYARVARFSRDLNVSQSDVLRATKAVSQALQISGATAQQASNGIVQFTQALAGGIVRAEEFNSIIETMPRLAEALADGLGITIGQLRKMVVEGKLASNVALGALISQAKKLNEEFGKLEPTIGQSFQQLGAELKLFGAELFQTTGLAGGTTTAVNGLASAVRGLTNQTKDVKTFFETLKDIFSIGKLALDNPFSALFSAQNYLRAGATEGLKQEKATVKPKSIIPVDIEEFRVTLEQMRGGYADVLREIEQSTRTSVEATSAEYIKLRTSLQFLRDEGVSRGGIDQATFERRIGGALDEILPEIDLNSIRAKYKVVKKETTELGEFMKGVWQQVGRSIQSTLSDALYEWKLSWKSLLDVARRALADITAAIITSGIKNALKNATSGGSSGSSVNWLSAIAGFFGFAAGGGRTDGPTVVGENGPEVVMGTSRVMNQRQMAFAGGGSVVFAPVNHFNIIEREDPDATKRELAQYTEVRMAQQQAEFVRTLERSGYQIRG